MASPVLSSQLTCQTAPLKEAQLRGLCARALACWHLASLDAPSVAVVWAYALGWAAHVHLQSWIAVLLFTGTWTVYVIDRILDSQRAMSAQTSALLRERHHFHWRNRRVLIPLAACTGFAAATIIVRLMPATAREHDSVIAAAALAYFSSVHSSARFPHWLRRLCSKEMLVGIIFAAGCAAPALTRLHSARVWPSILSFAFLASLAWLNCAAISRWESNKSSTNISSAAVAISLAGFAAAIMLAQSLGRTSALFMCAALSALMIAGLSQLRRHLEPVTLRALADLVLLTPAILLISRAWPG